VVKALKAEKIRPRSVADNKVTEQM